MSEILPFECACVILKFRAANYMRCKYQGTGKAKEVSVVKVTWRSFQIAKTFCDKHGNSLSVFLNEPRHYYLIFFYLSFKINLFHKTVLASRIFSKRCVASSSSSETFSIFIVGVVCNINFRQSSLFKLTIDPLLQRVIYSVCVAECLNAFPGGATKPC